MPKRNDIKKILILGSGPIIIGQACEFDYSGAQACKSLMEEGYEVILINSNPATIMTDPNLSTKTYIEPIHFKTINKIIEIERPDALLPTMGGQIALNCSLELHKKGILDKYNIELIGSTIKSICKSEDRDLFEKSMNKIGIKTALGGIAKNLEEAIEISKKVHFPCIIRPSFTMGGSGGGIAYTDKEFKELCINGLKLSLTNELLIDKSLIGWKEYELELIRDNIGNCIVICSIENIDPMGIHTGDSITVAPAQTLSDKEFQKMRYYAKIILKEIGISSGGSNVQFAVNPINGKMIVVEMNPRVSRSSALASKSTGFPIAKISAKLSIGYTLDELYNEITGKNSPAAFEPSLDYIVTKIPRFNFEKFKFSNDRLTTQMKSVGEVMGIGRTFQESLQKAMCSMETGTSGFDILLRHNNLCTYDYKKFRKKIKYELKYAGPDRLWYIGEAFRKKWSIKKVSKLTNIDLWFLYQIKDLIITEEKIKKFNINNIKINFLKNIKKKGFSDLRISQLIQCSEKEIQKKRNLFKIFPTYKRIDSCSAEFPTKTAYMYSTWEDECESNPTTKTKKIIVLGSGPNRIGQGIEFDYCCVHSIQALKESGFETIMINCNPETVSTDYDISDKLYFEPITLENILSIVKIEKPIGIIIQFGGQTPLKLAKKFKTENIQIIGTQPEDIEKSEDRNKFQKIVKNLNLHQPKNYISSTLNDACKKAEIIGYPIIIRPSYVLGGRNMEIIYDKKSLCNYFYNQEKQNKSTKLLLDKYLQKAIEIDVDAIYDGKNIFIGGIMEHVEQAGIHSGDSACSLPTYTISEKIKNKIRKQTKSLSISLSIKGLINIQFAIKKNKIYVLEVNPRASRTIPFISKATGIQMAKIATKVIIGKTLKQQNCLKEIFPKYFFIKEVVFPFSKFSNVNPFLGPEMRSTGEVMGIGKTFPDAFLKTILSTSKTIKNNGRALLSIRKNDRELLVNLAIILKKTGFNIDCTLGTFKYLKNNGISSTLVYKKINKKPNLIDNIKNKKYVYIVNTADINSLSKKYSTICNIALKYNIHYDTTINGAFATIQTFNRQKILQVISLQELYKIKK